MKLIPIYRVTTYVPPSDLERVLSSILKVVSLRHGNYEEVAWWSEATTEQFKPLSGANPTSGASNALERLDSIALQFALPRDSGLLLRVLTDGLIQSHPWEEPAIVVEEAFMTLIHTEGD